MTVGVCKRVALAGCSEGVPKGVARRQMRERVLHVPTLRAGSLARTQTDCVLCASQDAIKHFRIFFLPLILSSLNLCADTYFIGFSFALSVLH